MRILRARTLLLACAGLLSSFAARGGETATKGGGTLLFVGGTAGDDASPTLTRLERRLGSLDPERDVVIFTGNYSDGELPAQGEAGRAAAEGHVLAHVRATQDFVRRGGRVYFLAGQHDFAGGGTKAVRRLRTFLNQSYAAALEAPGSGDASERAEIDVMPQAGCGDTTLIELGKRSALLLVDSEWWMQDWANDPFANEGCEVKTRTEFQEHLHDALMAYRNGRLIIASHHPLRSDGEHGGSFTGGAHLSPLPVVGTFWVLARQAGLVEQYQNHPMMRSYVDLVHEEAQRYGAYVFASGHDANLQYLLLEKQVQIVSGTSASTARPTVGASAGDFAAATPGWAELSLEPSGAGEVRFLSGNADDEVLFTAALPELAPPAMAPEQPPPPFPTGPVTATFTRAHVWHFGPVLTPLIGSFYSDAYQLKLTWPTLNLETEEGGFEVKGMGGGLQTNALKLRDANGGSWVLRAVTKDSSRVLPWPQNQTTFLNRMLDHGYTASHPEAALAMPRLSEAVGVLHADPRLLYLPDQERLGRYRGYLGDELVLLERRPNTPKEGDEPETLVGAPGPEGKTHFRTTEETIAKTIENPSKHHVDQEDMLRSRLLDMFVGDWDRHQGQWRFAATSNEDGTKTYRPISRDRDQVFASYDGLGLFLARIVTPSVRVLRPFTSSYGPIDWLNYNARNIDPVLLNQIPRERWLAIAKEVQAALTDQVIDEALATWRPETFALDGARIAADLKTRRDGLVDAADGYFLLLNRDADILGSTGDDVFDLWFEAQGAVRVAVHGKDKHGGDLAPFFDRLFEPSQTSELRIYALEGDDTLTVHGDASTSICVRFVGGPGNDTVTAEPGARTAPLDARAIRFYDAVDGGTIDPSVRVRDERSNLARFNEYDQNENHDPGFSTFLPGLSVNPDDGLWLGGRYTYTAQGYKMHPFAGQHALDATFATSTLGAALGYHGLFPQSVGPLDQHLDLAVRTPTYTRNFFGLTNQLVPDAATADYYRVRQAFYEARYGIVGHPGREWTHVGAQVFGQVFVTDATPGRFVAVSPEAASGLGPRAFAGARLFAELNTFDDAALPTRGVALHASAEGRTDVVHGSDLSVTMKGAAAAAFPFDRQRRFVLISRAKVEGIVGDHPFYFAPTLGGGDLRGYRFQQLAGDVAFAQTTDLRVDVVRIYSGLPGTIGLNLSVDHGKVFGPATFTSHYHLNYGGGLWWCLLDTIGVSLNYYRGLDGGSRFVFALGPLFSQTGF
jgi:hypothetical protein